MGMALTAERFLHGDLSLSDFSAPPVASIWQLQEIAHLTRSIHLQDIIQFSAEYMNAYLAQFVSHSLPTTSSDIRSLVRQLLQTGDHPLVNLRQEITHFEGHVMNAYDLEQGPLGADDFFLRVYDPNAPFQKVEDTDGPEHQKKEEGSRVHVTRWTLAIS